MSQEIKFYISFINIRNSPAAEWSEDIRRLSNEGAKTFK
jgi:hypothetical protein